MTHNISAARLLAVFLSLSLWACSASVPGGSDPVGPDAGSDGLDSGLETLHTVVVTPSQLSLSVGDTADAQAIVKLDGDIVSSTVAWTTADNSIATVDGEGHIAATGVGLVKISATSEGQSASMSLTVTAIDECPAGQGNNGDSCDGVTPETWRCVSSSAQGGAPVSQLCRDGGWITFNLNPIDCCSCAGSFSTNCCEIDPDTPSNGCPP